MAYRRTEPMVDDRRNGGSQPSVLKDEDQLFRLSDSILDARNMEDAEDANIVFERPLSHPPPSDVRLIGFQHSEMSNRARNRTRR